ncbi:MAG: DNA-processing protein DprA, partial [Planktomarina sp.]
MQRLRLLRSRRVGVTTYFRLMQEHGTAARALDALPQIAGEKGIKGYQPCPLHSAEREYFSGKKLGATLIHLGEAGYSTSLATISDAPPLVWAMGNPEIVHKRCVAVVGARNASSLGTRMARQLAGALVENDITVVSGLARGIDAAAHDASKDGGTVAVQAGGVDIIYPSENAGLAHSILDHGLRLSEQPIGMTPMARHFPRRNRIISGLCSAVIVVEAAAKSGTLITARQALDQGRDVLAVPGHPIDARASGCNMLIRDGATLVRHIDDVLEQLSPKHEPVQKILGFAEPTSPGPVAPMRRDLRETAALHSLILNKLGPSPSAEDQLIRDLHQPA